MTRYIIKNLHFDQLSDQIPALVRFNTNFVRHLLASWILWQGLHLIGLSFDSTKNTLDLMHERCRSQLWSLTLSNTTMSSCQMSFCQRFFLFRYGRLIVKVRYVQITFFDISRRCDSKFPFVFVCYNLQIGKFVCFIYINWIA